MLSNAHSVSHVSSSGASPSMSSTLTNPTTQTVTNTYSQVDTIYGLPEVGDGQFIGDMGAFDPEVNQFNGYDKVLQLVPGDMVYNGSSSIINAWNFIPNVGEYQQYLASILSGAGVSGGNIPSTLKFYMSDISMTDAISNQYGDNILSSVNNMMNQLVGDYSYMSGGNFDTFKEMMSNNLKSMLGQKAGEHVIGMISSLAGTGENFLKSLLGKGKNEALIEKGTILHDILSGYKIDLPKTWKNSTNTKQIGGTIRLMSAVDNPQAIIDRIIIPYAALLALASPRSTDKYLYKWPFVVHAKLPGYADIRLGVITDLSIQKGADGVLSFDNKYLSMTINITIAPLYNTQFMVKGAQPGDMLTVNQEIKQIVEYFMKQRVW